MMAVSKALDEIKFRIPKPILDAVFLQRTQGYRQTPISLDEHLLNAVIRPRVLVDCNLVGGTEDTIRLDGLMNTRVGDHSSAVNDGVQSWGTGDYISVVRVPKDRTQGRSIQSVLSISYGNPSGMSGYGSGSMGMAGYGQGGGSNALTQAGSAVMNAMAPIPVTSSARVQLIGENTVMVRDSVILPANSYLRCVLAHDENMSHLQLKSYRHFSNLVTLAVKAYIYNSYIIEMDMGQLMGGQAIGRFKEVIDGFADAEELYQTYLTEKWEKVSLMNDQESYTRLLRVMIGGNR